MDFATGRASKDRPTRVEVIKTHTQVMHQKHTSIETWPWTDPVALRKLRVTFTPSETLETP